MFKITEEVLDPQAITQEVMREENGAVVTFLGVVRVSSRGKRVLYLEYDAYPEMAEKVMRQIGQEVAQRWPVQDIAIYHRIGHLEIGEVSLVVAVASPHRQEAFEACHYAVERVKQVVPIWKKEVWEDGESWVEGEDLATVGAGD